MIHPRYKSMYNGYEASPANELTMYTRRGDYIKHAFIAAVELGLE